MKFYFVAKVEDQLTKLIELKDGPFTMCDLLDGLLLNWSSFTHEQRTEVGKALDKAKDKDVVATLANLNKIDERLGRIGVSLFDSNSKKLRDFECIFEDIQRCLSRRASVGQQE